MHRCNLYGLAFFCLFNTINCTASNAVSYFKDPFPFTRDTAEVKLANYYSDGIYVITDTIDLNQKSLYLPYNSTLSFRGGVIRNGNVIGDKTILKFKRGCAVFDSVHIGGSWNVGNISSSLFKDLSYCNSIKDVFALTNPKIHNTVVIEKGTYEVTANSPSEACVLIESNTDVILEGDIFLTPNDFIKFIIVKLEGNNITFKGTGSITGDKYTHAGKDGEWGMGIYVMGGRNIRIKGLTVKNCWGDCMYITNNADDVVIDKCDFQDGRRQGISIISAKNVIIKNCTISKVRGTPPGYAIDVEPNKGDTIMSVTIKNIKIYDCYGGILTTDGMAQGAYIDEVRIGNCRISDIDFCPLTLKRANKIVVHKCDIQAPDNKKGIVCYSVNNIYFKRTFINGQRIRNDDNENKLLSIDYSNKVVIN